MASRTELNQDKQEKLEQEERKEHQRKIVKRIVKILLLILMLIFFLFLYITKIGTVSFLVNEKIIVSEKISTAFHGLKIIQISDIHYDNENMLKKVVKQINLRNPDLVFFTGDLLKTDKLSSSDRKILSDELKKIEVTLGKYAILGETDNNDSVSILTDVGFTILDDNYDLIYKDSLEPILLIGINSNKKNINMEHAFGYFKEENHNDNIFTIAMFHHPDIIDDILSYHKIDIAMAGHSHLGEVRIPYIAAFASKYGAKKYNDAYYEIENTKFYISSGLGTSKNPYRYFARPSIEFYRLIRKG